MNEKYSYLTKYANFYIDHRKNSAIDPDYEYELLMGATHGHVCPPLRKSDIEGLISFLSSIIKTKNNDLS